MLTTTTPEGDTVLQVTTVGDLVELLTEHARLADALRNAEINVMHGKPADYSINAYARDLAGDELRAYHALKVKVGA